MANGRREVMHTLGVAVCVLSAVCMAAPNLGVVSPLRTGVEDRAPLLLGPPAGLPSSSAGLLVKALIETGLEKPSALMASSSTSSCA